MPFFQIDLKLFLVLSIAAGIKIGPEGVFVAPHTGIDSNVENPFRTLSHYLKGQPIVARLPIQLISSWMDRPGASLALYR